MVCINMGSFLQGLSVKALFWGKPIVCLLYALAFLASVIALPIATTVATVVPNPMWTLGLWGKEMSISLYLGAGKICEYKCLFPAGPSSTNILRDRNTKI